MPTLFKTTAIARIAGILALLFSFSAQSEGDCYAIWHNPLRIEQSSITVPAGAKVGDLIGHGESYFSVRLLANAIQFSFGEPGDLVLQAYTRLAATALRYYNIPVYQTGWQGSASPCRSMINRGFGIFMRRVVPPWAMFLAATSNII